MGRVDDLNSLADAFFDNLVRDNCEYGGIGVDSKRPFGNSDVSGDILEIIGAEPQGDDGNSTCFSSSQNSYADSLYDDLIEHLQKCWNEYREKSK